jgi:hypothetical protein
MKYIILALLMTQVSYAETNDCTSQESAAEAKEMLEIKTDVPSHLKGAVIIVRLADGRETTVPAEKFKVVPRMQQFVVTKTEKTKVTSCVTNKPNKNRVSLLGGHGTKEGLDSRQVNPNLVEVESRTGLVGGLQYQRMLNDRISVGVQGQTNETGSLLIGLDF